MPTADEPSGHEGHRDENEDVDAERGAIEQDLREQADGEAGNEQATGDGSVQGATSGRPTRAGSGRLGFVARDDSGAGCVAVRGGLSHVRAEATPRGTCHNLATSRGGRQWGPNARG